MPPPTSTDDKQGTVIDGTARSAEWREKQRAAERPQPPGSREPSPGVPGSDFDPVAAKDFVSSLMIPANKLAGETREKPPAPDAPDPYINTLLDGAREQEPAQEPEGDAIASSAESDELDRWFEEQATSVAHEPAGQTLLRGSASLDIETERVGAERGRRRRALRLRRARTREDVRQHRGASGWRRLRAGVHLTRLRVLAGTTVTALSVAAIAIAAGGSPAHRSPTSSAPAASSTTFPSLLDTFGSTASRLPGIEGLRVHAGRQDRRRSHRTRHTSRHRPIAHRAASTDTASSSSYTPPVTSQANSSPTPATSPSSSASSGGGSGPAPSSSAQTRTGPSGPISLIGAGTTPSG